MIRRNGHPRPANGKKTASDKSRKAEAPSLRDVLAEAISQCKEQGLDDRTTMAVMTAAVERIAQIPHSVYSATQGETEVAAKKKSPTQIAKEEFTNSSRKMPYGTQWEDVIARGVRRRRESLEMRVSQAIQKFKINHHQWTCVEVGLNANTTGSNLGRILDTLFPGESHADAMRKLIDIGEELP